MNTIILTCILLFVSFAGNGVDAWPRKGRKSVSQEVRGQRKAPRLRSVRRGLGGAQTVLRAAGDSYHYQGGFSYRRSRARRSYIAVPPPRGARLRRLPARHAGIRIGATSYSYFGGAFYWRDPALRIYVSVGAPVGAIVSVLPPGHQTVMLSGTPHYVIGQDYYVYAPERNGYRVVAPPTATEVPATLDDGHLESLPPGYQTLHVHGEELYLLDGAYYRYDKSRAVYERTMPPPGTSLKELPPGCETIYNRGEETYLCQGVYYRYDPELRLYVVLPLP